MEECWAYLRVKTQASVDKLNRALDKSEEELLRTYWRQTGRYDRLTTYWTLASGDFDLSLRLFSGREVGTLTIDWAFRELLSEEAFKARVAMSPRDICDGLVQGRTNDIKSCLLFPLGDTSLGYKTSPEKLLIELVDCGPDAPRQLPLILKTNFERRALGFCYTAALRAWEWEELICLNCSSSRIAPI